jgi:3-oxoadipate enol-lactonase
MFAMWADIAPTLGVPFVMRDVALWAFTVAFFEEREDEAKEFEAEMAGLTQPVHAYLGQLNVIQTHDTTDRLAQITTPTLVLAGEEDILIPVRLSRRLHAGIPGATWATVPGGHACLWESPEPFQHHPRRLHPLPLPLTGPPTPRTDERPARVPHKPSPTGTGVEEW